MTPKGMQKASKEVTKLLASKQLSTFNCYQEFCFSWFEELAFIPVTLVLQKELAAVSAEECGMSHQDRGVQKGVKRAAGSRSSALANFIFKGQALQMFPEMDLLTLPDES